MGIVADCGTSAKAWEMLGNVLFCFTERGPGSWAEAVPRLCPFLPHGSSAAFSCLCWCPHARAEGMATCWVLLVQPARVTARLLSESTPGTPQEQRASCSSCAE